MKKGYLEMKKKSNKRVAILTQPLGHNYGGLLQAYALQKVLCSFGFSPVTIDRADDESLKSKILHVILFIKMLVRGKRFKKRTLDLAENKYIKLKRFRDIHVNMSPVIRTTKQLVDYFNASGFELVVVGSDQVWRRLYSPYLPNFFLDFMDRLLVKPKAISYAASFGTDTLDYSKGELKRYKIYINNFSAISVREKSGVSLIREFFYADSRVVVDPTLLLSKYQYAELLNRNHAGKRHGVATYILDKSGSVRSVVSAVAASLELSSFDLKEIDNEEQLPCITSWLGGLVGSEFVVTDSFHGTVFSLIFEKPFIVVLNKKRGITRLTSLLSEFGLEDRVVTDVDDAVKIRELVDVVIDWATIRRRIDELRSSSLEFLAENIQ